METLIGVLPLLLLTGAAVWLALRAREPARVRGHIPPVSQGRLRVTRQAYRRRAPHP